MGIVTCRLYRKPHRWKNMIKNTQLVGLSLLDIMGSFDKLALMRWEENPGSCEGRKYL